MLLGEEENNGKLQFQFAYIAFSVFRLLKFVTHSNKMTPFDKHPPPPPPPQETSLLKTLWEKEKLLVTSNFSFFPTVFSTHLDNFLPFLSDLKLLSANSFSWEESKICHLVNGLTQNLQSAHPYKRKSNLEGPTWLSGKVFDS